MTKSNLLTVLEEYKCSSYRAFKNKFCGKQLGEGCYREVYECKYSSLYVIKMNHHKWPKSFNSSNIKEYLIWNEIKDYKDYEKHFAPIIWINDMGSILIQRKVKMKPISKYPKKVPHFFGDLKTGNYGWIGKRFVCSDYGNNLLTAGYRKNKFRKGTFRKDYGSIDSNG